MKSIYIATLGIGLALITLYGCDCQDDPDEALYFVVCIAGQPTLWDALDLVVTGILTGDWDCEDTSDSPPWPNSMQAVNSGSQTQANAKRLGPRAAGGSSTAYLPHALLDLPFLARPSSTDNVNRPCNASQPDVIQVNHDNAAVDRISTCPFQAKVAIPVVTRPLQIAITPDGSTALVTSFDNAVNFIDLGTNTVTFTLQTDSSITPNGIAITPDGTHAYITNFSPTNASVAEIDLASRQIVATIPVEPYPQSVFISPDGSQLYVTFPFTNQVEIIDTLTNSYVYAVQVGAPRGIAFNSKGTKAYISSAPGTPGTVQELDTNTFRVANVYTVGAGASDVTVVYGDRYVIVNSYEGNSISVIDTVTGMVQTKATNGPPSGIAVVK